MKKNYQPTQIILTSVLLLTFISAHAQPVSVDLEGALKLGYTTDMEQGTLRWNGADFEGYTAFGWRSLTYGGVWSENGSDLYFNGGNIGLGTTNPGVRLNIVGTSDEFISVQVSGASSDAVLSLTHTDNPNDNFSIRKWGATLAGTMTDGTSRNGSATAIAGSGVSRLIMGTNGPDPIHLSTDNTTRVFIKEDGDVGIGTLSPAQKMHLKITGADGFRVEGDGTGDARAVWLSNTGGGHFIYDDNSDNHSLDIETSNEMAFNTGGPNERMRIQSSGEIGINTSPNNNSRLKCFTNNDLYAIEIDQDGNGTSYGLISSVLSNGTNTKFAVSGSVSGTTGTGSSYGVRGFADAATSGFYAVYAAGDLAYTGALMNVSDRKLKKNIRSMQPVLDKVMQLQAREFEFDRDTYHGLNMAQGPQLGFIAQEVQVLFPSLVEQSRHALNAGESDLGNTSKQEMDILSMKTIELIPVLTRAIQEQQEIIEELKTRVDILSAQNKAILERLD